MNNSKELDKAGEFTKTTQLSQIEIFEILQNERRRYMLQILRKRGSQDINSLTEEIIRFEGRDESDRKSVFNSILNNHIPMMMNLNVISYEKENETVKLLPLAKEFNTYIETTKKGDIPWSKFFFGLSTILLVGSIVFYTGLIKIVTCRAKNVKPDNLSLALRQINSYHQNFQKCFFFSIFSGSNLAFILLFSWINDWICTACLCIFSFNFSI